VVILQDIATAAPYFFQSPDYTSDAAVSLRKTVKGDIYRTGTFTDKTRIYLTPPPLARVLKQALRTLDSVPYKDATRLHDTLESLKTELGVGTRDVMNTMRHALTGSKVSIAPICHEACRFILCYNRLDPALLRF
jgi:hypothetical protein